MVDEIQQQQRSKYQQQLSASNASSHRRRTPLHSIRQPSMIPQQHKMHNTLLFKNSSIYLLGLLTWAVVIVQALATSPSSSSHNILSKSSPWGLSRGGSSSVVKPRSSSSSLKSLAEDNSDLRANNNADQAAESTHKPINGAPINGQEQHSKIYVNVDIPNGAVEKTQAKKTIVTPGGFADTLIPATYVAETNLPTDIGHYRIRAYRIEKGDDGEHPLGAGAGLGSEPCIIYCTDKPPFGDKTGEKGADGVPVRIHDQCFTSEVFRSQR